MKLFTILDLKTQIHSYPLQFKNAEEAIREFKNICKDEKTKYYKNPEDFTLLELADWDNESGVIKPHQQHLILSNASDHVQ